MVNEVLASCLDKKNHDWLWLQLLVRTYWPTTYDLFENICCLMVWINRGINYTHYTKLILIV